MLGLASGSAGSPGTFKEFKLKFDTKTNQHKGYGFIEYNNRDVAMCALRNLNGFNFGKRELKVSFAADDKQGSNLKEEHMEGKDVAEVVGLRGTEDICFSNA